MSDYTLLQTKFLIPHLSPNHVARQSLVNQICSAESNQRVLLIAPAGYGKTSLLAEIADTVSTPLTWIQLDDGDNDPATFMAYLIAGLQRQLPDLDVLLSDDEHIEPNRLIIILINLLLERDQEQLLLILDDYHVIHNPTVHQLVTTLLDNLPVTLRVIIASRITPVLPLAKWRARNQLLELRAQHLRFSFEETQQWMATHSYELSHDVIAELFQKTEGWGAGIQLALALVQENDDMHNVVTQLSGTQAYIFDYLMEEVFAKQSEEIQSFLLRSSVFNELNPQTCAVVLDMPSAPHVLQILQKHSLFIIRLDKQQRWYRYHQLFRDFLLSKFRNEQFKSYQTTQQAVAQFFEKSHQSETAIQHYLLAEDEIRASKMLCDFADGYLRQGRVEELQTYLNQLSKQTIDAHPEIIMLQGRVLRHNAQLGAAIERFYHASIISDDPSIQCQALLEIAAVRQSQGQYQLAYEIATEAVSIAKNASNTDMVHALMQLAASAGFVKGMETGHAIAEQAYQVMQSEPSAFSRYDKAKLLHMLGQICWWHGDANMAIEYCQRALHLIDDSASPLRAQILITLSTPTLYQKDHKQALALAQQAIDICQQLHLKEILSAAYAALGNGLTRLGKLVQAESALRTAIAQADEIGGARYSRVMAAGYLAQNLALQGRIDEARQLAEQALIPYENQPVVYDVYVCRSVLADILLDTQKLNEARKIYESLIALGETTQYHIPLAMAYFGLAYILMQEEKHEQAIRYSQQSLQLLEPTQMPQLYLDQQDRALVITEALVQRVPDNAFAKQIYQMLSHTTIDRQLPTIAPTHSDRIEVQTLGGFTVSRNGILIESRAFASARARDLLAYFVTMRDKSISMDRAIEAIWEDHSGSTSGFHTALYRVRVALRTNNEKTKFILSEVGDYRLDSPKFDVDVDQFDNLLKRASHADAEQSAYWLENALDLYKGDYLDNLYYDWCIVERERLQRDYITAIKRYSHLLRSDAQMQTALNWLQKALELEPYDEHLHIIYMQALADSGQQQHITTHYQHLRELLQEAFGAEPMQETQQAYQHLIG